MSTTVTVKGQVTLPKSVRDATGIRPGDRVNVRATAAGSVHIEKTEPKTSYEVRLRALARRRLIRGDPTTDEFMELSRGEKRGKQTRRQSR
jgi:antitoxin PrlF